MVNTARALLLVVSIAVLIACTGSGQEQPPQDVVVQDIDTTQPPPEPHPTSGRDRIRLGIGTESFLMEVSDDDRERILGLGGRTRLGRNEGMIFVYPKPKVLGFWMKDCLIDLEILYVRGDGRIMSMHRMPKEPPRGDEERLSTYEERLPRYPSRYVVQFALEFAPGTIERLGLRTGQVLALPAKTLLDDAR